MKNNVKIAEMDLLFPVIEEIINNGQTAKIKISGTSMYPLVSHRRDSVVLIKARELKVGDVPLYKRANGRYVLHRIAKIEKDGYAILGDFETEIEYPVPFDAVVAVAKGFYRKDKYISCDSLGYKIYWRIWLFMRPVRPVLIRTIKFLARLRHKLKGKK